MVIFYNYFNLKYTIFTETLVLFFPETKNRFGESGRYLNLKIGLLISAWGVQSHVVSFISYIYNTLHFTCIYEIYVNIICCGRFYSIELFNLHPFIGQFSLNSVS
jgi:hypothetical protein